MGQIRFGVHWSTEIQISDIKVPHPLVNKRRLTAGVARDDRRP
ncbi:MAG: hypothetical protein AAF961_09850 [Planctomycetota bacterium]